MLCGVNTAELHRSRGMGARGVLGLGAGSCRELTFLLGGPCSMAVLEVAAAFCHVLLTLHFGIVCFASSLLNYVCEMPSTVHGVRKVAGGS